MDGRKVLIMLLARRYWSLVQLSLDAVLMALGMDWLCRWGKDSCTTFEVSLIGDLGTGFLALTNAWDGVTKVVPI